MFKLTKDYTAFPAEDEALLQDGLVYQVRALHRDGQFVTVELTYDGKVWDGADRPGFRNLKITDKAAKSSLI